VRLAALDLMEISGVDLESPELDPGNSGISMFFHLIHVFSLFCLNVTFRVNSVELVFLDAHLNSWR